MRVAHLADLHVTGGARLDDQRSTIEAITDAIVIAGVDLILIAGDLFGRHVPHVSSPAERSVLYPAIVRMAQSAPVIVITGNHCHDLDVEGMANLGGAWPVRVITTPTVVEVQTMSGIAHLYCIPYPTRRALLGDEVRGSVEEITAAMHARLTSLLALWGGRIGRRRATAPTEPHVLLAHLQVSGSRTSGGEVLAGNEIEVTRGELDGVPFDYGALGHLHLRQEVARRCFYPGSPWRNDFGETDAKGWHLVEIAEHLDMIALEREALVAATQDFEGAGRLAYTVRHMPSPCRTFVTLDYRWSEVGGIPGWSRRPTDAAIEACADAEVRMRLVVSVAHVGGCPWESELVRVGALAHRVQGERKVEPVIRVRAPEVAEAITDEAKMIAYFGVLATKPTDTEQGAAVAALRELASVDDEGVGTASAGVIAGAA